MLDDDSLLRALRGQQSVQDICQAAGITVEVFAACRDAYLKRRLPGPDARLQAAVRGTVEILRDRAGIPHVYASTTEDLYFGLGLAMAQDRLWQIDRLRRRALGQQSAVLGPEFAKSDLTHRTVGIDRIAAAEVERTDERTREIVEAFARGINRQIEACERDLPVEFAILGYSPELFTARDVIAILRGIWWSLNGRLELLVLSEASKLLPTDELRTAYLMPESPEERIVPVGSPYPPSGLSLPAPSSGPVGTGDGTGSNNWAVAGRCTASGHAILCCDPHQGFWLPPSWYEYAVHGPEDDAAGSGHPGVPGLWWGANGDTAWGVTNNAASTRDLYLEQVHPADAALYRDGDSWRSFREDSIEIEVRGQASVHHKLLTTVRGPIVNHLLPSVAPEGDPPLSLRWVGQEHLDDVRAAVAVSRARDWPSFREALKDWAISVFNFVYADAAGRVAYQCAGRVPIRGRVVPGYRVANNPSDVWQGYVPFEALPRLEDPALGYVASANNRVAPDDYPYPIYGAYAPGYRAVRIRQGIESSELFDVQKAIALQNDVKSCRAERLCPPLVRRLKAVDDPDVRLLVDVLGEWDYHATLDSPAPAFFETFSRIWQERVAAERFPERLVPFVKGMGGVGARLIESDDLGWFEGGTQAALEEAAKAAVVRVRATFGVDPKGWRWGAVHQAHWRHPLSNEATASAFDVGPVPVDGSGDTVRCTGAGAPPYAASGGSEYRFVFDFAAPARFLAVQNVGNSGQPGSPHYADQFPDWLAGRYHVVNLKRSDVERETEGRTRIAPE